MDLKEYDKALSEFDWSYEFANENTAWERGIRRFKELKAIADTSEVEHHALLFDFWHEYATPGRQRIRQDELERVRKQLGVI